MLQSLKLRADKLSGLPATATAAAAAAATTAAAAELPPAPVAVNVNGQVYNLNKKPSNGNGGVLIAENNNLNNIQQQQQQQRYHYQQQQQQQPQILLHQGKYSESFAATSPTAAAATASKSFHPYLRPPPPLLPSAKSTTTATTSTKSPPPSPSPSSTTAATTETLFQAALHKQINSGATTATAESALAAKTGALTDAAGAVGGPSPAPATTSAAAATADPSLTDSANQGLHFCRAMIKVEEDPSAAGDDPMIVPPSAELALVPATAMVQQLDEFAKEEPDPDNIKMFVGQVPKAWDEKQLRALFEQFGRIHTLNVLRDKVTSVSRGCCFVTYYTRKAALRAQDALHNIKTLDGMHHPIQMKPADSENRNERKLFVGMLNKKYTESDVRQLFAGHGTIEECTVLRDQNGQSKGCAFVTFGTKQHAIGAIKALHQSQTMESCSAPLVVKFADTQKEKDQKKMQHLQPAMCGLSALSTPAAAASASAALTAPPTNGCLAAAATSGALVPTPIPGRQTASMAAALAAAVGPQQPQQVSVCASSLVPAPAAALTVTPSLLSAAPANPAASPYFSSDAALQASAAQLQLFQQLQAFGLHPTQYLQGLNFPLDHSASSAAGSAHAPPCSLAAPLSMQNLVTLATLNAQPQHPQPALGHVAAPHVAQTSHAHLAHLLAAQQHHKQHQQHQHQQQHLIAAQPMAAAAQLTPLPGAATLWSGADGLNSPFGSSLSALANGAAGPFAAAPLTAAALQAAAAGVAGKQIEGPEGSNLFIYHLPQEFTDTDLASTFLPFGNVLSAKVFIDKQTNLSKCFGFVSYDNPLSASAAIQAMHGFQIGTKRLKVQLKRSKDAAKPY